MGQWTTEFQTDLRFATFSPVDEATQSKYPHYNVVIMSAMASQITSLKILYSTVCSGAEQRSIKTPPHWPLWGEFTGDRWIPRTKGQWREKCFHLMTSSCCQVITADRAQIDGLLVLWRAWQERVGRDKSVSRAQLDHHQSGDAAGI